MSTNLYFLNKTDDWPILWCKTSHRHIFLLQFIIPGQSSSFMSTDNSLGLCGSYLLSKLVTEWIEISRLCGKPLIGPKYVAKVHFLKKIQKVNYAPIYWPINASIIQSVYFYDSLVYKMSWSIWNMQDSALQTETKED